MIGERGAAIRKSDTSWTKKRTTLRAEELHGEVNEEENKKIWKGVSKDSLNSQKKGLPDGNGKTDEVKNARVNPEEKAGFL